MFKDQVTDQDLDDAGPNTNTLPANYVWSFTVATGTAPPFPASVHLTMGNPSGAIASIGQPNNYLMEKAEFALSYSRDSRPAELGELAPVRRMGWDTDASGLVPPRSRSAGRLVPRAVVRFLRQRIRSRSYDAQRGPRQGDVDPDQPGDLPDVEHAGAVARQQSGALGRARELPQDPAARRGALHRCRWHRHWRHGQQRRT